MEYASFMAFGARVLLTGSVISTISKEMINTDWGYPPISIKNAVKVRFLSAASSVIVMVGFDKFMQWKNS